jgi:hypothetical protein
MRIEHGDPGGVSKTPCDGRRRAKPSSVLVVVGVVIAASGGCRQRLLVGELGGAADGGPGGDSLCVFAAGDDLQVCAASYLSGAATPVPETVDFAPDGTLVIAGAADGAGLGFGPAPVQLLGGGAGMLLRLGADGHQAISVARLGQRLVDMEVDHADGRMVVAGPPFGVALLSPNGAAVEWSQAVPADRVAAGPGGIIAALGSNTVTVLDGGGATLGHFSVAADMDFAADVSVQVPSGTVVLAGWTATSAGDQPVLAAYGYTGERRWLNWGWSDAEVVLAGLTAPGRGVRVATGRDGKIYFLGQSEGGATVFTKLPRDLTQPAPNVVLDDYAALTSAGNAILTYVARVDAGGGNLEVGQFLVTRDAANGDRAQDVVPGAIAADEHGTVIVGGSLACCLDRQAAKTVAGARLSPSVPDAFVAVLATDFVARLVWTTLGTGGPAVTVGAALSNHMAAVVLSQDAASAARDPLVTVAPLQGRPTAGVSSSYFALFPTP